MTLGALSALAVSPANAQQYPSRPIRVVVPYPAGGTVDVAILGTLPLVIAAGPEQPFKSLAEMIAHAKSRPGQIALGYTDASTLLFGEMLKNAAGIDIRMIPYKGGAPMLVDVMGGHIQLGATGAGSAHPHHKSGKVRVLAVSESRRAPSMPEIPTIAESGTPGFNVQVWIAVLGPAGMPAAVVNRLNTEIAKVLAEPAVAARLVELGTIPKGSTPAETASTLRSDMEMWSAAARKAGIKPE